MAIHIAGMSLPGPTDVLEAVRAVTGWGAEATEVLAGLPARAEALLSEVEQVVRQINDVAGRADRLVTQIDAIATAAERTAASVGEVADNAAAMMVRATEIADGATGLLSNAGDLSDGAGELLRIYRPMASQAAPLAQRFIDELADHEIVAAIRLVDQLPALAEHMETDVMPILTTLDRVGPDIHEMLNVVKDLRKALDIIPGVGMLRRRGSARPEET